MREFASILLAVDAVRAAPRRMQEGAVDGGAVRSREASAPAFLRVQGVAIEIDALVGESAAHAILRMKKAAVPVET